VSRFQKFVSLQSRTVSSSCFSAISALWVAFKNLYLCSREQLHVGSSYASPRCESLSKICIFAVANSNKGAKVQLFHVVSRFQKFVSLQSRTVQMEYHKINGMLWVAFKNLYLCSREQFDGCFWGVARSCESLSKICIFAVANSFFILKNLSGNVVSRFQKFVSLQSRTVL